MSENFASSESLIGGIEDQIATDRFRAMSAAYDCHLRAAGYRQRIADNPMPEMPPQIIMAMGTWSILVPGALNGVVNAVWAIRADQLETKARRLMPPA